MQRKRTKAEILARLQELLTQQEDLGGQLMALGGHLHGEFEALRGGDSESYSAPRDIDLDQVLDLLGRLAVAPTQPDAVEILIGACRQLLPTARGALCSGDRLVEQPAVVGVWGADEQQSAAQQPDSPPARLAGRAPSGPTGQAQVFPILGFGLRLGELRVWPGNSKTAPAQDDLTGRAELIARCAGLVLGGMSLRARLAERAIRDPLTGLFSQPFFLETLERDVARARREGSQLGVVIVDIDRFGQYNDRFGYDAGNTILEAIAASLAAQCHDPDLACRFSGERFAVAVPGNAEQVIDRAHAMHDAVAALRPRVDGRELPGVTLSGGLAICPDHADTAPALLAAADAGLQLARQAGGNALHAYEPPNE